jgi:outer membrane protein
MYRRVAVTALTIAVAGVVLAGPLPAQEGASGVQDADFPSVAFVNTQEVVMNAPGATEAQQTFQAELKEYQAEVEQMQAELDSLTQALEQQRSTLTPEAEQRREEEIVQKRQELQQRAQQLEQEVGNRQQELLQPILERVQGVIETLREERGYALVFDVSGPGVVAADPSLNITQDVLQRLEEQQASGSPSVPGGPGR